MNRSDWKVYFLNVASAYLVFVLVEYNGIAYIIRIAVRTWSFSFFCCLVSVRKSLKTQCNGKLLLAGPTKGFSIKVWGKNVLVGNRTSRYRLGIALKFSFGHSRLTSERTFPQRKNYHLGTHFRISIFTVSPI